MSDTQTPEETPEKTGFSDPYLFIASLGGPSKEQIEAYKQSIPNGRLRVYTPDGKRAYIVRCISGLELGGIQKSLPPNCSNPEYDTSLAAGALCTIWTNASHDHKLSETGLRGGSAGLPSTLWALILELSDFTPPDQFAYCSAEL